MQQKNETKHSNIQLNNTQQNGTLSVDVLSVIYAECCICLIAILSVIFAECRYAECHGAPKYRRTLKVSHFFLSLL